MWIPNIPNPTMTKVSILDEEEDRQWHLDVPQAYMPRNLFEEQPFDFADRVTSRNLNMDLG